MNACARSSSPSCVVALIALHTRRFVVNSDSVLQFQAEGYEEVLVAAAAFAHKQERTVKNNNNKKIKIKMLLR